MIADITNNKKTKSRLKMKHLESRKWNISIVFITQSYFKAPKDARLNSTYLFIMKISKKRELQQITLNRSSDIGFKDFKKIYKKSTAEPYFFG